MFDVITFGQATLDVFLRSKEFKIIRSHKFLSGAGLCEMYGGKIELDDIFFTTGGGATNNAVSFERKGLRVAVVSKVGKDPAGESVKKDLEREAVNTTFIKESRKDRTGYSVVLSGPTGDRSILVYRGASATLSASEVPFKKLRARWFHISSLAGNLELLEAIINFAKKRQIKVSLNPGAKELGMVDDGLRPLLRDIDVLILNRFEASRLTQVSYNNRRGILKGLGLLTRGISVVTEGRKGAQVCDHKKDYFIGTHKVTVVDTVGAGDAFGSGFVAGLVKNYTIKNSLQLAAANASSVVTYIGAKKGLLRRNMFPKLKIVEREMK